MPSRSDNKYFLLTRDDRAALTGLLARERSRPGTVGNTGRDLDEQPASEVYVARAPEGGIPGMTGTTPGYADCVVYRVIPDAGDGPALEEVSGAVRTVYNLGSAVAASRWLTIKKDKYGFWWPDSGSGSGDEADPNNPELPTDCGGCGWTKALKQPMCLFVTERYRGGECGCEDVITGETALAPFGVTWSQADSGATWNLSFPEKQATINGANPATKTLRGLDWGAILDAQEVPDDATITGIELVIGHSGWSFVGSGPATREVRIQLRNADGVLGTNKSTGATLTHFPPTPGTTYGGSGDEWGLTEAERAATAFRSADFGIELAYESTDAGVTTNTVSVYTQYCYVRLYWEAPLPPINRLRMRSTDGELWTVSDLDADGDPKTITVCGVEYALEFHREEEEDGDPALYLVGPEGSGGAPTFKGLINKCGLHWITFSFYDPLLCTSEADLAAGPLGNMICLEVRWDQCYTQGPAPVYCCGDAPQPKILCLLPVDAGTPLYDATPVILEYEPDGEGGTYGSWLQREAGWLDGANDPLVGYAYPAFRFMFGCSFNESLQAQWGLYLLPDTTPSVSIPIGCEGPTSSGPDYDSMLNYDVSVDNRMDSTYSAAYPLDADIEFYLFAWDPVTGCVPPTTVEGPWGDYLIPRTLWALTPGTCSPACAPWSGASVQVDFRNTLRWNAVRQVCTVGSGPGVNHDVYVNLEYFDGEWTVTCSVGPVTNLEVSYDPFLVEFDVTASGGNVFCPAGVHHWIVSEVGP
jgi:hypothetical protein